MVFLFYRRIGEEGEGKRRRGEEVRMGIEEIGEGGERELEGLQGNLWEFLGRRSN